jgi:hypothetical protein
MTTKKLLLIGNVASCLLPRARTVVFSFVLSSKLEWFILFVALLADFYFEWVVLRSGERLCFNMVTSIYLLRVKH